MEITELKKYSRPRRTPLIFPLKLKPRPELRGEDFKYHGTRYKVIGRSKTRPVTHWRALSLSERLTQGQLPTEIEFEEILILEILAEKKADQVKPRNFSQIANGNSGMFGPAKGKWSS